ncbi:hypothetical protein [Thioclava sp.]|uniref:hypothetical protein n=1 Tax=Thioclava sp. TaxID=1933450 RepID=UPI003242C551
MSSSRLIGRLRVVMGLDDARFRQGLGDAATGMRRLGQDLQRVGAGISARVTAPILAAGAATTAAFVTSADSLADLQRQSDLAGMSAEEFKLAAMTVQDYGIEQDKLADILKDVNDKFGDFVATGAGPLADFFEEIGPTVGLTIDSFKGLSSSDALALYVTALEDANVSQAEMTFYMEALASDATALIPAFRNSGAEIRQTAKRARELGLEIDESLIKGARDVRKDFALVSGVLSTQLQQAIIGLAPVMATLMTELTPLLEGMMQGVARLAEFTTRLAAASPEALGWGIGLTVAAAAIGPFLAGLGFMISGIASVGSALAKVTTLLMANPIGLAVAGIAGAAYLILRNWDAVGPWFARLWDDVRQIFSGFGQFLSGVFKGEWSGAIDGLKTAWDGLTSYYQTLWDGIRGVFTAAWEEGIKPITDKLGMTDEIQRGWERLKSFFTTLWDGIVAAFEAAWARIEPIVTKVSNAVTAVTDGRNRLLGSRDGPISSGYDPATDPGDAGLILPPAGGDVAAGYAEGVNGGQGAAYQAGAALGAATEEGLRDQTETRSPSQLMRRIGGYLVDGLRLGIADQASGAEQDMANLGSRMADALTIGRAALGDFFGSILDGSDAAKEALLGLIKQIAQVQFTNGVLGLPGMGAIASGIGSLLIPSFARGTPFSPEGMARLNERGGEILNLPRGTQVIPHDISKRMADGAGGGELLVRLQLSDDLDARIMRGADRAANVRVERFASAELPGRVSEIRQYEEERM